MNSLRVHPRILLMLVVSAVLIGAVLYTHQTRMRHRRDSEVEHIYGVRTYRAVCIEEGSPGSGNQITVYGAPQNCSKTLHMQIRPERQYRHYHRRMWPVHFKTTPIPKTYTIRDIHAYFVPYSRYGNLHHFLHDSAENLYATMETLGDYKDGRLQVPEFHILAHTWDLYAGKHGAHVDHLGVLKKNFEPIERALGATYNDVYTSAPANTCYSLGAFGFDTSHLKPLAFEDALRRRWDMTPDKCSSGSRPQVLVIQRRQRRIANMDQILTAFKHWRRINVTVVSVDFEDLTMAEQVQMVSCSSVLIGIHGAGIDHHRFLKPNGGLLVISFKPFPSDYYREDARFKQQGYATMPGCPVHISEDTWAWYRRQHSNASKEEVFKYSATMKHHITKNIWRYSECEVNVPEMLQKTEKLLRNMAKQNSVKLT